MTQCAADCLWAAIRAITPGCLISEIGDTIVGIAEQRQFSVVREYVGHGLGRSFTRNHPSLTTPRADRGRNDCIPVFALTIEPMINVGKRYTALDKQDGWTVRTRDSELSAQFEHTILMTEEGLRCSSLTQNGPQDGHQF